MKENVGNKDQIIRSIAGPALIAIGYLALGGKKGKVQGLAAIVVGTLLSETAITRVCPANEFFGVDTREKKKSPIKKIKEALI